MKPSKFPQANASFGEGQPHVEPLPAFFGQSPEGEVISCWGMTWRERLRVIFTGRVWVVVQTFNNPLQPMILDVAEQFEAPK